MHGEQPDVGTAFRTQNPYKHGPGPHIFRAGVHVSMWEVGGNVHTLRSDAAPVHGGPALCWLECGSGDRTPLG